jgi:hypothetical protein
MPEDMNVYPEETLDAIVAYGLDPEGREDALFPRSTMASIRRQVDLQFKAELTSRICLRMAMLERSRGRTDAPVQEWRDEIARIIVKHSDWDAQPGTGV